MVGRGWGCKRVSQRAQTLKGLFLDAASSVVAPLCGSNFAVIVRFSFQAEEAGEGDGSGRLG